MKQIYLSCLLAGAMLLFNSCGNDNQTVQETPTNDTIVATDTIIDEHNAKNSLDYVGTYEGTIPCFSKECKEVEISVKLMENDVFVYSTKRVGMDKEALLTSGNYHFEKDGNTIVLDQIADVPNAFFISEGKIFQLDKDQKKIEGPDAEKYILKKK